MYTLKLEPTQTHPNNFVEFWKQFYNTYNDDAYKSVVGKEILEEDDIRTLFEWKNNMGEGMAGSKEVFITAVVKELDTINELKKAFSWDLFDQKFRKRGPTWMITLLHVINQDQFPIYDQHAFRAYMFIDKRTIVTKEQIPKRNKVYEIYKVYKRFFDDFKSQASNHEPKEVDSALWAFGKFLSLYPNMFTP